MAQDRIVITGLGMSTPVGVDMAQTCASVRAGISRFREYDDYECEPEELDWGEPEPVVGSRACHLESGPAPERAGALVLEALQDLVRNAKLSRELFGQALTSVVLPPADRSGLDLAPEGSVLPESLRRAFSASPAGPRAYTGGTGFFDALREAIMPLQEGRCKACVIACADSYHDAQHLARLDRAGRLKCKRSPQGFIPGESGACVLLETRAAAEKRGADILAVVGGIGSGTEPAPTGPDLTGSGRGLAEAVGLALQGEGDACPVEWVACDLNGEVWRAREWGLCQVALSGSFKGLKHVWHPADCLGDIGAASGAVLVSLAARAFQRGYAPAERCLVFCATDSGERAALVLGQNRP